jgi:hypothetical protein
LISVSVSAPFVEGRYAFIRHVQHVIACLNELLQGVGIDKKSDRFVTFTGSMEKQIQPVKQYKRFAGTGATNNCLVAACIHLNRILLGRSET